jgi:hypothetical protein
MSWTNWQAKIIKRVQHSISDASPVEVLRTLMDANGCALLAVRPGADGKNHSGRSLGLTLVTNNTREFGRVQNLAIAKLNNTLN